MKGYGQFCPIAMACETFAERWTPLILRELLAGARRFNEIRQGVPLISRTLLMWNVRRRIAFPRLPDRRIVVRFDFRAFPARCRALRTSWLVLERGGSDVCLKDPGYEVDLVVSADAGAMARVWTGATTFAQAVRDGGLRVEGPRDLVRAFPTWLLLSHFAHVERPARA